ncbi:MAG: 1-acyl-sn-glycerol-3-phosphate acyltransferase, partial [Phycisphaerales bacterium]|nr:1-acyl-sn-glycerol-3-phosphate acyltransferase [Phycisphaerales bacterium]
CNHQSYLDPLINGASLRDRPSRIFARLSLFNVLPFRLLIRSLGAVPISGEASDKETMRLGLAELAAGRSLLVYPEGARTMDGAMGRFKPGIGVLLKRSKVTVVPVGIDGAFDAWPRGGRIRLFRKVESEIGAPIQSEALLADGVRPALGRLEREVDALRMRCRARIRERTRGRQPAAGPADDPFQGSGSGEGDDG